MHKQRGLSSPARKRSSPSPADIEGCSKLEESLEEARVNRDLSSFNPRRSHRSSCERCDSTRTIYERKIMAGGSGFDVLRAETRRTKEAPFGLDNRPRDLDFKADLVIKP